MAARLAGRSITPVLEYQFLTSTRFWRSLLVGGLVTPLFYVLALGVGLGHVVNRNAHNSLGVPYLVFVAPAFLVAAAMQVGAGEGAWPVMSKFKWQRVFHGMAATPLTPATIADGVLVWVALRLLANATIFFAIVAAFGGIRHWSALLAIPIAVLVGLGMAAPVAAYSASQENEGQGFNVLFRFIVTPMFLFSGTFYPISKLPEWGQWLAYATPLYHGTQLARDAALHTGSPLSVLGHLTYLVVLLGVGVLLAHHFFRWRLTK